MHLKLARLRWDLNHKTCEQRRGSIFPGKKILIIEDRPNSIGENKKVWLPQEIS